MENQKPKIANSTEIAKKMVTRYMKELDTIVKKERLSITDLATIKELRSVLQVTRKLTINN